MGRGGCEGGGGAEGEWICNIVEFATYMYVLSSKKKGVGEKKALNDF